MRDLLKVLLLLVDELVVVIVVLLVLPRFFHVRVPWSVFAILLVAMALFTWMTYNSIRSISSRPAAGGRESLIGCKGKVVRPLEPEGTVRIGAETWKASCPDCHVEVGKEVQVVNCQGITLLVKPVPVSGATSQPV